MKDLRLVICCVIGLLLVLLCLFKCTAEIEDAEGLSPTPTSEASTPTRIISLPTDDKNNIVKPDIELIQIEYYTITGAGGTRIDTAETLVEKNVAITPELIADYCIDSFMDEDIEINVSNIKIDDGMCTVDFDDTIYEIAEDSKKTEVCVLDAIAMSIIDNCKDIDSVSFTINSKEYATKNLTYKLGSVYLSK